MAKKPAKKTAKKRKAPVSRSGGGPKAGVDTGHAIKAMQKVLGDLKRVKQGETNWNVLDRKKVKGAEKGLKVLMFMLKCPPASPSMSFP